MKRRTTALIAAGVLGLFPAALTATPAAAATAPVDLRILVLDDGQPMVGALKARLAAEGVPTKVVDLTDTTRTRIDAAALVGSDGSGAFGRYSGVVLPSEAPAQLSPEELAALARYEVDYGVREINAYTWAHPGVGLNYTDAGGFSGAVDGTPVTVDTTAANGAFSYLTGSLKLDDISPSIAESWGYVATPSTTLPAGASFTPLVTATTPSGATGSLMGVYAHDGREQLVVTFASNQYQAHFQVLAHGMVRWLTRGVSLSYYRNWFSVHSDDQYMADALWSIDGNCTIGATCDETQYPSDAPGATARMTAEDVNYLVSWQRRAGMKVDLAYNGSGRAEQINATGWDAQAFALQWNAPSLRFINHTYSHPYLGCAQDKAPDGSWVCKTDANGNVQWTSRSTIVNEIDRNFWFGVLQGLPVYADELVTGEHSGLKTLPQMPTDNPNLAPALTAEGVRWVAADASREKEPRQIGSATTVPRYPMNVYYNTATKRQAVDEYNWIYTSRANGGSGYCEDHPETTTCITPLDLDTGWESYIVPMETRIAFGHVIQNDPRPHYAHQSNMTQDRILFSVLDSVLGQYRATYASSAPLVNPRMRDAGQALADQQRWASAQGITARLSGTQVKLVNTTGSTVRVPVTTPTGSRVGSSSFGQAYAGESSAWVSLRGYASTTITLANDPGYGPKATTTDPAATTATTTKETFGDQTTQVQNGTTTTTVETPTAADAPIAAQQPATTSDPAVVVTP